MDDNNPEWIRQRRRELELGQRRRELELRQRRRELEHPMSKLLRDDWELVHLAEIELTPAKKQLTAAIKTWNEVAIKKHICKDIRRLITEQIYIDGINSQIQYIRERLEPIGYDILPLDDEDDEEELNTLILRHNKHYRVIRKVKWMMGDGSKGIDIQR